jgi:hypothetical protein
MRFKKLTALVVAVAAGFAVLAMSGAALGARYRPDGPAVVLHRHTPLRLAGTSAVARTTPASPTAQGAGGLGGAPLLAAPLLSDPVLYDQNNNDGGDGFVSSSNYDTQAADDFAVPAGVWNITSVSTTGSDFADLSSVTVTIYSDSSGSPGSQVYTVTVPSGSFTDDPGALGYPGGDLTIPIDATLPAGHYWLSVQGNGGVSYYWEIRTVVSNDPAMWQNPTDNYGSGCTSWSDMATCFNTMGFYGGGPGTLDLMFSLSGTTVYVGTPGQPNCVGKTVSALSHEYNGLSAAAQALGFDSVKAMQQNIKQYCRG